MSDYSKYFTNLAEQLRIPPGYFANLTTFRPSQKALMYVGAATVACVMLGLSVKSLRGRGNGQNKKRHSIDLLEGSDKLAGGLGAEGSAGDAKGDWSPQSKDRSEQSVGEGDAPSATKSR